MTNDRNIRQRMPAPYDHIEINVNPVTNGRTGEPMGHSVGVMDTNLGQGSRSGIDFAEAKAKAVLKAIRAYRRKNPS